MYELASGLDWAMVLVWVITWWTTFVLYDAMLCIIPPPLPPRRHSLDNSPFKKLPLELVGYIAQFMTPSTAASFTLTCKPIWFILGNQSLDRLWARDFEPSRRAFLELLGRDLPYHVMCLYCNQLHRSDRRRHRSLLLSLCGTRPLCEVAEREQNVHRYINPNFSYIQLQSARKLYYPSYYNDYRQKLYDMLSYNEVFYLKYIHILQLAYKKPFHISRTKHAPTLPSRL
jgi:hypothetical protein